ncbi:stage VI sporulation protein F [Mycoplasmatota bacterium]|nr:stage VI sporulation protein F [Mycoplasmatota bacterium]
MGKLFQMLADQNINKDSVMKLAASLKNINLEDEENIRKVIKDVARIAGKTVDRDLEDQLVSTIKNDGLPSDLFNMF